MKLNYFIATVALSMGLRADPIILADFEGPDYGAWKVEGTAFGSGPAQGTLPHQMHVDGYRGHGLANSYHGGDGAVGTLTSPPFKIERPYLNFLIGGGGWEGKTCMNLLVDGKLVRSATGQNTKPGGSETLEPASWDVHEWLGHTAQLVLIDQAQGGWGHLLVDQIELDDHPVASLSEKVILQKDFKVTQPYLLIPIANEKRGKNTLALSLSMDAEVLQTLDVTLPQPGQAFWWAAYPLSHWSLEGQSVSITLAEGTKVSASFQEAFAKIHVGGAEEALKPDDYTQPYRNQLHASTRRGWNNDPNGMVYAQGKYHLYYQYNPVGIFWGNMHWGHLESADLVHWDEQPIALFQKTTRDAAYSGGGFVDEMGSGGAGKGVQWATFTSTGRGECAVYSLDGGKSFKEIAENPVVKHRGRDPRVFRDEARQQWVMAVYDEEPWAEAVPPDAANRQHAERHVSFYVSKNLHAWQWTGAFSAPDRSAVFECPDIFELPIEGKPNETRWILMAASNRYFIGQFDGKTFHAEVGPLGTRHGAFYAAQTFSQAPQGRRIEIGWLQTNSYEKIFPEQCSNQGFTLPHELTLRETTQGLRLFYNPVKELEVLRDKVIVKAENLDATEANRLLLSVQGNLAEVTLTLNQPAKVKGFLNGIPVAFEGQEARIYIDRTVAETYADKGLSYEITKRSLQEFHSTRTQLDLPAGVQIKALEVYLLRSIWTP
jgi:fructan beta-fructosidase